MRYLIKYYFRMAFLQAEPQECPPSRVWQAILILLYVLLSIINALALYGVWRGFVHSILDIAILYLFTHLLLRNKKERIHQTFNAFLGVGICIGLIHTFCSYSFIEDQSQQTISDLGKLFFFSIFIWVVIAYGHIIHHASGSNFAAGVSISLGYTLINAIILLSLSEMLGF